MRLDGFDHDGDCFATTNAKRSQAALRTAITERIDERGQNTCSGSADWVAKCHGATAHIHVLRVERGELAAGHGDTRKGLVYLPQVDVRRL